ncbi:carbohydrate ABC transporter permease [Treponema sp.]
MPWKKRFNGWNAFISFILILLGAAAIYPMIYIFVISISDGNLVMAGKVFLYPRGINFKAYQIVFESPDFLRSYANTLLYTFTGTLINLGATILYAYPLSRRDFYGRTFFTAMIAFTMFFSGGLIPSYLVVKQFGLINTMWALIFPVAINTWYMIIMRTFFQSIPDTIQESAHIDGANDLVILLKIIIPLSVPIIATMILFYAVYHWNSFFSALIYLNEKKKYPVQIILRNIVIAGELERNNNSVGADTNFITVATNFKYAVIIISTLPILAVYPFIQKYFTKGVMVGAIKG